MWTNQTRLWRFTLCLLLAIGTLAFTVAGEDEVPSESQCRPYIEKALKGRDAGESQSGSVENDDSKEDGVNNETKEDTSAEDKGVEGDDSNEDVPSVEVADEPYVGQESAEALGGEADDSKESDDSKEEKNEADQDDSQEDPEDGDSKEVSADDETAEKESTEDQDDSKEEDIGEAEGGKQGDETADAEDDDKDDDGSDEKSDDKSDEKVDATSDETDDAKSDEKDDDNSGEEPNENDTVENDSSESEDKSEEAADEASDEKAGEKVESANGDEDDSKEDTKEDDASSEDDGKSAETGDDDDNQSEEEKQDANSSNAKDDQTEEAADGSKEDKSGEDIDDSDKKSEEGDDSGEDGEKESVEGSEEGAPEEDLLKVGDIPDNLRSRDHIVKILRLDEEASEAEITIERSADIVLRDLKRLYETAIKPLETVYKYRDLSNRHFGDPEIFSKPLVLFMGPWSGGKSSLINYLTGLEFTEWSLRTGAEPSPAYFNILMHGKEPEVLDGTQLAADWTFSGLQKFGQGLEERLRGLRYPSKLLEKVNIVEIPGILEVRKQVSRVFPFNDACQWFIDRADIIFLVYDPSKLDVGPETEAILDQLKGRESQTRILLNKADSVKPEELMRVQSALIWNISPLMSSAQPPVMYTVSLWSMPYEASAPVRLLQAQERELLKDLRSAVDRRIDNKIASARRFAVRVRNHAKMVDCYLTTYYNHKTIFGNKKLIAEAIIENPQNYHIYEGLSTLTNISRYDLPDPETYRDFFRLNPVYEFQQLSATCTYFRGCPINRLDVAIAYDFPELVGKYKKMVETATPQGMPKS